jgi:hypothetical protein
VLALPAAFSRGIFVQLFQPKRFSEPPASGFVVASESMRDALATANAELEVISTAESEGVLEGWKDIELGLVLNHGASLLIARGSPNVDLPARRAACLRLVWTRAADLQLIGDSAAEPFVHAAMELFARTGVGQIFSVPDSTEFRLHVREKRVRFVMCGACVRVLGVFASA